MIDQMRPWERPLALIMNWHFRPRPAVERFGFDHQTQTLKSSVAVEAGAAQRRSDPWPRMPAPGKSQVRRDISTLM